MEKLLVFANNFIRNCGNHIKTANLFNDKTLETENIFKRKFNRNIYV